MAVEYRENPYAPRAVAASPPEPTIGLVALWVMIFLIEILAVFYAVHIYAHLV